MVTSSSPYKSSLVLSMDFWRCSSQCCVSMRFLGGGLSDINIYNTWVMSIYLSLSLYIYIHIYLSVSLYLSLSLSVDIIIYIHTYVYVCMYVCIYIYMYVYIYIYIYMYMYIHTYIHTSNTYSIPRRGSCRSVRVCSRLLNRTITHMYKHIHNTCIIRI